VEFQPDIFVKGPDGLSLVVEAKTNIRNLSATEEELKRYMVSMNCSTGALVTPERMWLYRDQFTSMDPESVQRIGEFEMAGAWQQQPPTDPASFELFVQQWLERLAYQATVNPPPHLPEAIRNYIVPAVVGADIRAAHPRVFSF
jgi:hypothetical protein